MNRRKELQQVYKETTIEAGIYQIRNVKNQKIWIDSTSNLKTINGKQFSLELGGHPNKELQKEWNAFGKESFEIEVLETLKEEKNPSPYFNKKDALKKLEEKWLEKLQPYGERGYH